MFEKEAEEYAEKWQPKDGQAQRYIIQGYFAGARSKEKRIEELEKENAELKKQQFSLRNERNTFLAQNEQYEKDLIDFNVNLTKAKEIIKNIIRVTWGEGWNYSLDWKVKAEQFLEEM